MRKTQTRLGRARLSDLVGGILVSLDWPVWDAGATQVFAAIGRVKR